MQRTEATTLQPASNSREGRDRAYCVRLTARRSGTWSPHELVADRYCPSPVLSDGRICLSNNAAERALRGVALGRKSRLFAGSDRGGERAAAIYSLIATAKLNDVDPQAWLADV